MLNIIVPVQALYALCIGFTIPYYLPSKRSENGMRCWYRSFFSGMNRDAQNRHKRIPVLTFRSLFLRRNLVYYRQWTAASQTHPYFRGIGLTSASAALRDIRRTGSHRRISFRAFPSLVRIPVSPLLTIGFSDFSGFFQLFAYHRVSRCLYLSSGIFVHIGGVMNT